MNLERLTNTVPQLNRLLATVELAKTFINAEERHGLLTPDEYSEAVTLLRQHSGHKHELLLVVFQGIFPGPHHTLMPLHKLGRIMDIVVRYVINVDLCPVLSMGAAKFFAELALMGRSFATVLCPMLRRWKKESKHDRALVQQVSKNHYFCGFHDMWILEFVLRRTQGLYKWDPWMEFPATSLTSHAYHQEFPWATPHAWSPMQQRGWSFALSISACLTPRDMSSVRTLCPFAKYIIQFSKDSQPSHPTKRVTLDHHSVWDIILLSCSNSDYRSIWHVIQGKTPDPHAYKGPQILIEYLPLDMTAEELNGFGWDHGKARSARLWQEHDYKVGIIEYEREDDFLNAMNNLDGRRMAGWSKKLKCTRWPTATRGGRWSPSDSPTAGLSH